MSANDEFTSACYYFQVHSKSGGNNTLRLNVAGINFYYPSFIYLTLVLLNRSEMFGHSAPIISRRTSAWQQVDLTNMAVLNKSSLISMLYHSMFYIPSKLNAEWLSFCREVEMHFYFLQWASLTWKHSTLTLLPSAHPSQDNCYC